MTESVEAANLGFLKYVGDPYVDAVKYLAIYLAESGYKFNSVSRNGIIRLIGLEPPWVRVDLNIYYPFENDDVGSDWEVVLFNLAFDHPYKEIKLSDPDSLNKLSECLENWKNG